MCDTINTTTVVVLFWTIVHDMLIYYKTWIYQCLIKQVKSPNIRSRVPETGSDPSIGSGRESGRDNLGPYINTHKKYINYIKIVQELLHYS